MVFLWLVSHLSIKRFLDHQVDIGLVPVAALNEIEGYNIVGDFCIGANGPVHSVMLFSDVELSQIEEITLDYQSKTSNLLLQYLIQNFWKINPKLSKGEAGYEQDISGKKAGLVIGDRALEMSGKFNYVYDLAGEWMDFTKLPFVFACWVAKEGLDQSIIKTFNDSLNWGMNNLNELIESLVDNNIVDLNKSELIQYFTKQVSYNFNRDKRIGLERFTDFLKQVKLGAINV